MSLLDSLFNRGAKHHSGQNTVSSSSVAKERLQLALAYDRVNVSPELMETIKIEILAVISKHFDIDYNTMEISLGERNDHLIANIPVRRTRQLNPRA
ncbi:MAG: cell division topological specificity factor MinE [Chloroflexi bacterium]|nr:cell division topological specificity factor MinE [Chloroflexota bacterium]OJW05369.1 MAG: cell division topological specificity factor MinE [Chloroflexi bacterium 54-19]